MYAKFLDDDIIRMRQSRQYKSSGEQKTIEWTTTRRWK